MVFPQTEIKQFARLERFDLDFDLPEQFLPEFPPAIFLTTRPDLGDVSQGKVVTLENFQEIFQRHPQRQGPGGAAAAGDAVPAAAVQRHRRPQDEPARRHEGRRLLRLPRQRPHVGGDPPGRRHPPAGAPPAASTRPSLRGVNIQRLFGSQRALKTVEDFTEFEQLAAYFDGDHRRRRAPRGSTGWSAARQVHFMAEFQDLLDFPPAPAWAGTASSTRRSSAPTRRR